MAIKNSMRPFARDSVLASSQPLAMCLVPPTIAPQSTAMECAAMDAKFNVVRRAMCGLQVAVLLGLVGCAGTIKQDARVQGDVSRLEGVTQVVALMSPDATKQLADNFQFNREELATFLRRRLEAKGLISATSTHQVQIVVTDIRVRSAIAAIMLGFMAGDDHVTGRVRVLDAQGRALRSFDVNATYALGGLAGGQDSMRMNWLYDKFSELAAIELAKVISVPQAGAKPSPAAAPALAGAVAPVGASVMVPVTATTTQMASLPLSALENADAVPVNERGRAVYRDWLTQKSPRAFVVSESGHWFGTWGRNPKDPMESKDPSERAMKRCLDSGQPRCAIYAVNDQVVYSRPTAVTPQ
jgi:hypothetical protein